MALNLDSDVAKLYGVETREINLALLKFRHKIHRKKAEP